MYNGVGLRSVRGSGTSGHIQTNVALSKAKAQMRRLEDQRTKTALKLSDASEATIRKANPDILEHENKRKIELQLCILRDELEAEGIDEDEIERQIDERREVLRAKVHTLPDVSKGKTDSHALAAAKARDDEKVRRAFGIDKEHVTGEAFDRELQERKREEARISREMKQAAAEQARKDAAKRREEAAAARSEATKPAPAPKRANRSPSASSRSRSPSNDRCRRRRRSVSSSVSDSSATTPHSRSRGRRNRRSRTPSSVSRSRSVSSESSASRKPRAKRARVDASSSRSASPGEDRGRRSSSRRDDARRRSSRSRSHSSDRSASSHSSSASRSRSPSPRKHGRHARSASHSPSR